MSDYCKMSDFEKERLYIETTEENCRAQFPYCDPLLAYREVKRWRDMQQRTYEDGCELIERYEELRDELAKVSAELAALKAKGAGQ